MQNCSEKFLFESDKTAGNRMDGGEDVEGEEVEKSSPFLRMKSKVRKKMDDLADDISREIKDELSDSKHIRKAENVANDLVDPDTLDKLKEIILEQPEIEPGCDFKLWYHIIHKSISYVLLKIADIITDFAAAYQHFKRQDLRYGALTLFFVYLPGLVISLGFVYWGFSAVRASKNGEEEPGRKPVTCKRFWRYIGVLFIFPLLYPIIQVLL